MAGEGKLRAGSVFAGEWEIIEPLGEGGMGALYVARQRSTGALRALKLMQRELVRSADMREKFEREARIGAQIESDHVAAVLAAGVDPEAGVPWIAMELLRGETLAARLARGPLPWPDVVAIFSQMCHGLAAAHRKRIVHRDLKPENLFLATPRVAGVDVMVKLLDFGIAKVVAESATEMTGVIGTPAYMAPEQYQGRGITPATDVWALGLMAFTMLTGRTYWRNMGGSTSGPAALMYEACMEDLVTATARATEHGVDRFIPRGFDGWFARCVARDPRDRFPTAWEALTAMRGVGTGLAPTLPQILPTLPIAVTSTDPGHVERPSSSTSLVPPFSNTRDATTRRGYGSPLALALALLGLAGVASIAGIGLAVAHFMGQPDRETEVAAPNATTPSRVTVTADPTPKPTPPPPSTGQRSALPSIADWNAVGEVTVAGSTALGCETKMIREWLRVSCHGANATGGTPTDVSVTKGQTGDTFTFAKGQVVSLLVPFVEGVNIEATFVWTDRRERLFLSWPRGTAMPASKGHFGPT